jgi:hypothetical protein
MRGKADKNNWANDPSTSSSGAADVRGAVIPHRYDGGRRSASKKAPTPASPAGVTDNSYGALADPLYFATTGP